MLGCASGQLPPKRSLNGGPLMLSPEESREAVTEGLTRYSASRGLQLTYSALATTVRSRERVAWLDRHSARLLLDVQGIRTDPDLLSSIINKAQDIPGTSVSALTVAIPVGAAAAAWAASLEDLLDLYFDAKPTQAVPWSDPDALLEDLIGQVESDVLEFKQSARVNVRTGVVDRAIEAEALKSVAALMNRSGGHLVLGVSDDRELIGLEPDYLTVRPKGADGFENWFTSLLSNAMGHTAVSLVALREAQKNGKSAFVVRVARSNVPIFVTDGETRAFFLRLNNSSRRLNDEELLSYVVGRFPEFVRGLLEASTGPQG